MIETLSRVIHPGWLTVMFEKESTGEWHVYHRCVDCGYIASPGDSLWQHSARNHKAGLFALELHQFRSELHGQHLYWGLGILEWPDTNWKKAHPGPQKCSDCGEEL